jgi:hypothetical protein
MRDDGGGDPYPLGESASTPDAAYEATPTCSAGLERRWCHRYATADHGSREEQVEAPRRLETSSCESRQTSVREPGDLGARLISPRIRCARST